MKTIVAIAITIFCVVFFPIFQACALLPYLIETPGAGNPGATGHAPAAPAVPAAAVPAGVITMTENQYAVSSFKPGLHSRTFIFPVTQGTRYHVWLYDADARHTLIDAVMSARYSNGADIFSDVDTAWPGQMQFTANRNDTVFITVVSHAGARGNAGHFAVVFNTTGSRPTPPNLDNIPVDATPVAALPAAAVPMTANQYAVSIFIPEIQSRTFTFTVVQGTRYHVWLYDKDAFNILIDGEMTARYSNGTAVFTNIDRAWAVQQQFTADRNDTVTITVVPRSSARGHTGEFSIAFNTCGQRPGPPPNIGNFAETEPPKVPVSTFATGFELHVFELTNIERRNHGLAPLQWDDILGAASRLHSEDMARTRRMNHTGSDGSSPSERITRAGYDWITCSENVAHGQISPEAAVRWWMNSPPHRANILNPDFTHLGAGFASNYWTQKFATPR